MSDLPDWVRRSMEEFERELEAHPPLGPPVDDPFVIEFFTNQCRRELVLARDDLDRARARYDQAVCDARTLGYSWGEIGSLLGVSRQQLHRRFSRKTL
jgi:AraC-like DNA-binding protein